MVRRSIASLAALLPLALSATSAGALAAPPPGPAAAATQRVIVQWAPGTGPGAKAAAREDAEVSYATNLGSPLFQLVEVEDGRAPAAAVAELEADPAVVLAERDRYRAPAALPDDPFFDQLWGLRNEGLGVSGFGGAVAGADVDAEGAWLRTRGSAGIVIAVLDSGYQLEHPDLGPVVWTNPGEIAGNEEDDDGNGYVDDVHGYDFVGANGEAIVQDADPSDDDLLSGGHGVHVAGTIAAAGDNGAGIVGLAPGARLMPLRVCSRLPKLGANRCSFSAIVNAINYAGKAGAEVANLSLSGTVRSQAEANALAANPGTLFVVAAGNDGEDNAVTHHYPCDFEPVADAAPAVPGAIDNVVCVAATDQADELAGFSDWGASSVDLGAPGTETLSTYPLSTPFLDQFTVDDFAAEWVDSGADGGFERIKEGPLTSFGVTDAVGAPVPSTVRASTTQAFTLPPNEGCVLLQSRHVELAPGDAFRYSVLLDGVEKAAGEPGSTASSGMELRTLELPDEFDAGGEVRLRLRFTAGAGAEPDSGVWVDDLRLRCRIPTYAFLQGTSMAAPHVSATAALLFSQQPAASVANVKAAILASAEPIPALAGITVTGGRLNASAAVDRFDVVPPPAPVLSVTPASPAAEGEPTIFASAEERSGVRLFSGPGCEPGSLLATVPAAQLAGGGHRVTVPPESTAEFSAETVDTATVANVSACSAPLSYENTASSSGPTVVVTPTAEPPPVSPPPPAPPAPSCTVPKLAGKTLAQAKTALRRAGCGIGRATKPKPRKGRPAPRLVVRSSRPAAGAATGGKVDLRLGPKPKAK